MVSTRFCGFFLNGIIMEIEPGLPVKGYFVERLGSTRQAVGIHARLVAESLAAFEA